MRRPKKLFSNLLLTTLVTLSCASAANARTWHVNVEDDLFSDTGKKAFLSSPGNFHPLVFNCDSSGISIALLERSQQTRDETRDYAAPVTLIVKVDDSDPIRLAATWSRRNEHYFHAEVDDKESLPDIVKTLKQIQAAKSKVLVGIQFNTKNFSESIRVNGSTAATTTFLKACGVDK